jgi:AraC-like DNA-binding protein
MTATYREYAPARLAEFVDCFWTIRGTGVPDAPPNRVLPDNCMDVIFDFTESGGPRIVGAMLEAIVLREEGTIDMLGVRFMPGAAPLFLGVAASELTASIVAADDVWSGTRTLDDMLRACAPEQRIGVLEAWLAERLRPAPQVDRARAAMAAIAQSRGAISLASLCSLVSTSNRTLLRSFMESVGVGPKVALRVARLHTAARMLERNPDIPISQVALECGYSDQPHLTHDFVALAGLAPNAYREERKLVRFLQERLDTDG